MMDVARTAGQIQHKDVMTFRATKEWRLQRVGEELSEANAVAQRRTSLLKVRVRDELVRRGVEAVQDNAANIATSESFEASETSIRAMGRELENVNKRIGEVLRTLDDEESTALLPTQDGNRSH